MADALQLQIDPEVFKFKIPLVERVAHGEISLEAFLALRDPTIPITVIAGTIYALTEEEFFASRKPVTLNGPLSKEAFKWVVANYQTLDITDSAKDQLRGVAAALPKCSPCRYNRYVYDVSRLVVDEHIQLPAPFSNVVEFHSSKYVYPEVTEPVKSKIGRWLSPLIKLQPEQRIPCFGCVQKHIAQAYVLGQESLLGYPDHLALACAHLAEALDELPVTSTEMLRETLLFCIAKSQYTEKPFIPVTLLLEQLNLIRNLSAELESSNSNSNVAEAPVNPDGPGMRMYIPKADNSEYKDALTSRDKLELTPEMVTELQNLPPSAKARMHLLLTKADSEADKDPIIWEGCLATAAEFIVGLAPNTAAMLRERRLFFTALPSAAAEAGYSCEDILKHLQ